MILYFRLFAGFTSFRSKRYLSQESWMRTPVGAFPSRITVSSLGGQEAGEDGDGDRPEADEEDDRGDLADRGVARQHHAVAEAERLEEALDAVREVEEEAHHRDDVDGAGDGRVERAGDHRED